MSKVETNVFAVEDIILPLDYSATNPEHVHFMESLRSRLLVFLRASKYSPKYKDNSNINAFRDNLLSKFAKLLVDEKLLDGNGEPVMWYDACDFVSWLYHGYKWLNAAVCEQYNKADGKTTFIMGFIKTVVDGITIIKNTSFDRKTKESKTIDVPSKHTNVDWSAWSGPQMIEPLKLRLSPHTTSHKKALYCFFTSLEAWLPKISNSPEPKVLKNVTLADHIAPKLGGGAGGSQSAGPSTF